MQRVHNGYGWSRMESINSMGKQQILQIPSVQCFNPDTTMAKAAKKGNIAVVRPHVRTKCG